MAEHKTLGATASPKNGMYKEGKVLRRVHAEVDIAAASVGAGDIVVLAEDIPLNGRVHRINAVQAIGSITGANDNDIGFYTRDGSGALVALDDGAELVETLDISSGLAAGDVLAQNSSLDRTKTVAELAGVKRDAGYQDIVLGWKSVADPTADLVLDLDIELEVPTVS